jgi:YesN/AraC family two-component response regulator
MALILIVDDDALVRESIKAILAAEGHAIREAENGLRADTFFRNGPPDLMITDILMPEREGIETIMKVRASHPDMKILAISGGGRSGQMDFLEVAQKFGAHATLKKPFDRKTLLDAVRPLLPR